MFNCKLLRIKRLMEGVEVALTCRMLLLSRELSREWATNGEENFMQPGYLLE